LLGLTLLGKYFPEKSPIDVIALIRQKKFWLGSSIVHKLEEKGSASSTEIFASSPCI